MTQRPPNAAMRAAFRICAALTRRPVRVEDVERLALFVQAHAREYRKQLAA